MRATALLTLLLAAPAPAAAQDQEPLTAARIRAMPAETLARRLLGDSGAIVYPMQPVSPTRGDRADGDGPQSVSYYTRPRVALRAGICETDFLYVILAPTGAPGPDTPLLVRQVRTSGVFIVQDVARVRQGGEPSDAERAALDAACAAIDPREAEIALADNAEQLGHAITLTADLLTAARAGRTGVPLGCRDGDERRIAQIACLRGMTELRTETIHNVELIDECDDDAELSCVQAWLWDARHSGRVEIRFALRWGTQTLVRIDVRPRPGFFSEG
ncbi:MAG: hypothetical protein QOD42_3102 [Sphingomonadales bacterium]|jgi:hypothetical protein|nr:hypothetical protein [Sphingomonadales bacterium]